MSGLVLAGAAILALVNRIHKTVHGYARTPETLPLFLGVAQTSLAWWGSSTRRSVFRLYSAPQARPHSAQRARGQE